MSLPLDKKINQIVDIEQFGVIQIKTSPHNFHKRFVSVSNFFKLLKNGLYSINRIPNRVFFKGLSGYYMSLEMGSNIEIIILYNPEITPLNSLQVKTRVIKLIGIGTEVNLGSIKDFQDDIDRISKVKSESRLFGDYSRNH
jgi:hypothetical protein